jgi:hypothetical protein
MTNSTKPASQNQPQPAAEAAPMDERAAQEFLRAGYIPSAIFQNDLPANWNIHIVQIGCKFIYDDGHNDNKAATVDIPGGGAQGVLTATHSGCCRAYFVVMQAREMTTGEVWNFVNNATVEQGYCGTTFTWRLVAERQVKLGDVVSGGRKLALKLMQ